MDKLLSDNFVISYKNIGVRLIKRITKFSGMGNYFGKLLAVFP